MAPKEARLELRTDQESKDRIARAAELASESLTSFVLHAAIAEADRVLARAEVTLMPAEQFDELLAALDVADEAPALARLSQRSRRYARA